MVSDPLIMGFDTSAAHCAAALLCGNRLVAVRAEEMRRGQAERLMPLLEELLAEAGAGWRDLAALGVGVGPGNFTGIRISVAAARGLALGLGVPAYGVDGFAARRLTCTGLITVPAARGQLYVEMGNAPHAIMDPSEATAHAARAGTELAPQPAPARLAEAVSRIAAARWPAPEPPPSPLYIRPADAAPARDRPPALLD